MDRPPGKVLQAGDRVVVRPHHHKLLNLVVRPAEGGQGLPFRGYRHGRGHDVPPALVQVLQQLGVALRDDDLEAQAVFGGELLHQLVLEPDLQAAVDEVGHGVVAREHAQAAAFDQPGQVVGELLLAPARELPGVKELVHLRLELGVPGPHHQGDGAFHGQHQRRRQTLVVAGQGIPQMRVRHGRLVLAAGDSCQYALDVEGFLDSVDAQGRDLLLKLDQGLVVGARPAHADLHAREVADRPWEIAARPHDQVLVDVEIGNRERRLLLALRGDGQAGGDHVPLPFQQLPHHLRKIADLDQLDVQLEGLGEVAGDVVVEGHLLPVPGHVGDRLEGHDHPQDAARPQVGKIPGVFRSRGRLLPRLRFLAGIAALREQAEGGQRGGKEPADSHRFACFLVFHCCAKLRMAGGKVRRMRIELCGQKKYGPVPGTDKKSPCSISPQRNLRGRPPHGWNA